MKYLGKVKSKKGYSILKTYNGKSFVLRRTGKSGAKLSKEFYKLDGRILLFSGKKMGKFLLVSKWQTLDYMGA